MTWQSFTEFFEGEGAVSARLGRYRNSNVLQIVIVIGQKWKPKLDQINHFLKTNGIDSARIYPQKYGFTLRVFRISAVKRILSGMLPCALLKKNQISTALSYLEGRITGDQLIAVFNHEYHLGKRRKQLPPMSAPLTRAELRTPRRALARPRSRFTPPSRTRLPAPASSS